VALEIMATVEDPTLAHGLANMLGPWSFWRGNPFAEASRREQTTLRREQRVWRMRYVRSGMS
jgi:tRNA (guanine-N7-)-methyltransferase